MGISAVALLESAHKDDATRYTTYLEARWAAAV